jgi:hypothetical protein
MYRRLPHPSRCLHPGQQQGRRWPSSSSSWVLRMRRFRVISCFASSTQQMNSLRAKGVMSLQAASAAEFAISASRRSAGSSCTTPPGTRLLVTEESRSANRLRRSRPLFGFAAAGRFLRDLDTDRAARVRRTSRTAWILDLGAYKRAMWSGTSKPRRYPGPMKLIASATRPSTKRTSCSELGR